MAKRPTINTLTNTASPTYLTQLNQNFSNIQAQFDNTLSLDGSLPNAMNADLDLNDFDLINAGTVNADNLVVAGTNLNSVVGQAATSASNAAASATSAAASAATASQYTPAYFNNVAALLADTRTWPTGQILNTRAEGFSYQVVTSGQNLTTAGGTKLIVLVNNGSVFLSQWGVTSGATETTKGNAFLSYLGSNGGTGVWDVECRGEFRLNSPANGFTLYIQKKIEASAISNVLEIVNGQGITIFGSGGSIDCRATALGATTVAQVYHGLVFVNCQRCSVYSLPTRDQNGTGILTYYNAGAAGSSPADIAYFFCDTNAVNLSREDTNGLAIADCVDGRLVDCTAINVKSFGLQLKNQTNGSITGHAENCGVGFICGQVGATAPGTGGCRDIYIRGTVKNCDQGFTAGFTLGGHVEMVVDQTGTLPGTGLTPSAVRLTDTVGLDVDVSHKGTVSTVDLRSGASNNTVRVAKIDSTASTWVSLASGADNNHITIDQAGNSISTGTFVQATTLSGKTSNSGSANSIVYLRAEKRVESREVVSGVVTGLSALGSVSTASQLLTAFSSIAANQFSAGRVLILEIQGRIVGAGSKSLTLQFGTSALVTVTTAVTTSQPFEARFMVTGLGLTSQRNLAVLTVNGQTSVVVDASTSINAASSLEPRLFARAFDVAGEVYVDCAVMREIGCRN